MKSVLTLKTSSMFFVGSVNLYKNIPVEINVEDLSPSTIRMVNQAIKSGRIESSEGVLETPVVPVRGKIEEVVAVDESPFVEAVEEVAKTEPEVTEDETPAVEAEVKAPAKKKSTPAKKKAE